jgi:type IV conjugative transfer system coupling protein TraD
MGFETFWNNVRMAAKMEMYIALILSILVVCAGVFIYDKFVTSSQKSIVRAYYLSFVRAGNDRIEVEIGGTNYEITFAHAKKNYKPYAEEYLKLYLAKAKWTLLIYLLYIPINIFFYRRAKEQSKSKFIRGSELVTPTLLNKIIKKSEKVYLPIGEVSMPVSSEPKHTFIVGRPGVGKTVCLSQILEKIIARGDRVIIHDFKGDYLQKFYRPGKDLIFNPLDKRSVYWNFFDEIESPIDVDAIGYALIPDAKGAGMDPFWHNAARDVFTGMINYLYRNDKKSYRELFEMSTSPSNEIAEALLNTKGSEAGAVTIADPESKQTGSIMSVLTQFTKIFGYMEDKGERFSIKEWLNNPKAGNIYITNYSDLQNTLAPILALMIDLFSRKLLSLPEDIHRRIFFILDEFGMLQKLQSIVPILTQSRSKGGAVFIGIQDVGQIDKTYGKEHRQSIVNACGSSAVFSVADSDTAKTLSDKYGEYISQETYITQSMGVADNRDGISLNTQKNKELLILPSEIISLADLNCFVKFPGYAVAKSKLAWKKFADHNIPFEMREGLSYRELMEIEAGIIRAAEKKKLLDEQKMKADAEAAIENTIAAGEIAQEITAYDTERENDISDTDTDNEPGWD